MRNNIAYLILRAGIGIVFLIFGIGKFRNDIWAETIKNMDFFAKLPWDVNVSVFAVGTLEIVTAAALITGFFTRFFSIIASLELVGILILLNFQETRDVGLLAATIYLALKKDDNIFSLDSILEHRRKKRS